MAGYRSSFDGNVDYAYGRGVTDITSQMQNQARHISAGASAIAESVKQTRNATNAVKEYNREISNLTAQQGQVAAGSQKWLDLQRRIEGARNAIKQTNRDLSKVRFDRLVGGVDKLTKGFFTLNSSILGLGFNFLIDSIKRVYELQERWTRAIGGFNMKMGGMTAGLKGATQAATRWSGVVRGLTNGDIGEGIEMFGEFTMAIGRVIQKGDQFEKFGLQLARGFNLGGAGAGQLAKVMGNIGMSGDEAAESMKTLIKSAGAAGIPTNMLAKDILDTSTYMARFGKEGQKTFIQGAAYARKYTISIEQLKGAVEGLDMFDEAAKTASRLNTAFGTMINSMDLMMEDDPAKRLEMIRQQFLAQGRTFDTLSPKQRRLLSETLKLTEDQTAALLSSANANQSYADFQAKAAKKEKNELSAKKMMEVQLRKTAQTMYAFGAAFDRITVAIANAIKPILQVFGLAKQGGKDFKSFGQVMEGITVTVEQFFNSLAGNEDWNLFMVELAQDLRKAGGALKDFVMDGRAAKLVGDIAFGMKRFYTFTRDLVVMAIPQFKKLIPIFKFLADHLKEIAFAWAGIKVLGFANSMRGGATAMASAVGGGASALVNGLPAPANAATQLPKSKMSMGPLGNAIGGIAGGIGAAQLFGGGAGATAGGAIGGAIGAFVPLVGPLMGPLGAAIGRGIEELFSGPKVKTKLEQAVEKREAVEKEAALSESRLEKVRSLQQARRNAEEARQSQADKVLMKLKGKKVELDEAERSSAIARLKQLQGFGNKTEDVAAALKTLEGGGKLSSEMFVAIRDAQTAYRSTVERLDKASAILANSDEVRARIAETDAKKKMAEIEENNLDQEIAILEKRKKESLEIGKRAGNYSETASTGRSILGALSGGTGLATVTDPKVMAFNQEKARWDKMIEEKRTRKEQVRTKVAEATLDVNNEMLKIATRDAIFNTQAFRTFTENNTKAGVSGNSAAFVRTALPVLMQQSGLSRDEILSSFKFARGGIVTSPTMGLVGEAGPEAIVPLKATASGQPIKPYQARSDAARNLIPQNEQKSDSVMTTQIADIHIDGQKAGRAIIKTMIQR